MRINHLVGAAALLAAISLAPAVMARTEAPAGPVPYYPTGVGPVISGSVNPATLPAKARKFITDHFPENAITDIEEEFDTRTFEVDLADGTDLEFDAKGEWTEVDAGHGALAGTLVKKLLPDRAYKEIVRLSLTDKVETVKRSPRGYKVELTGTDLDDLRFDREGHITSIGV